MSQTAKLWGILACMAALTAVFMFLLNIHGTREKAWQIVKPDLMEQNASLKNENEGLKNKIASLDKQNMSLKKYLDAYENNFIELKDAARNCCPIESMLPIDLPEGLIQERFEIRQIYREMIGEKKRWDQYQQEQYKGVLESTVEPDVIDAQSLNLENKENLEYFLELESALKLHKRLIRDVRLFYDEIQFQKKQLHAQKEYELYDLKFRLGPFAQQSSITLGSSAFGELDFFNRRLSDRLYDLYLIGQDEAIDPSHLDLDELEQVLNSRY